MDQQPQLERIAVITSGGDAPGMNAAVRAVVRTAISRGVEVVGFLSGYRGLIGSESVELNSKSVGGIISQGGTILRTARSMEFREPEGRSKAMGALRESGAQGIVIIGGDGSMVGAGHIFDEFDFPTIGVPASIDNDIAGTDFSVGFDTAVNTALEAIDKIRDTAYSHERVFVIEVMGRANGFIAIEVALASGAEACLIPEVRYSLVDISENLMAMRKKGKRSSIVVVAEGAAKAADVQAFFQRRTGFEARYSVLGHVQRGGRPTAFDRVLALRLGSFAVEKLLAGVTGEMVGVDGKNLVSHPLGYVAAMKKTIDTDKLKLVEVMAQ
ncbi:MAG: 6-phosphofructokinase [Armatimonadetes bacterium]|nr:6-phosphofructokinase [Armatimonadota bacterium]